MRKKITAAMLSFVMAASLMACGSSSTSSASNSSAASGNTQSGALSSSAYNMTYITALDDEFLGLLNSDIVHRADALGVNMDTRFAGGDSNKIIDCVRQAQVMGMDAVIINMASSADAVGIMENRGDMKVVFVNRIPDDLSLLGKDACVVASDEHDSGGFQGDYLVDYFKEKGMTEVRYILLQGTPDLVHTTLRSEAPLNKLAAAGITMIPAYGTGILMADYNRATAASMMTDVLATGAEFDCIISNNDAMALGAVQAIKEAGLDPSDYVIVGIDALSDAMDAIGNDEMSMSVLQSHENQADGAVRAAMNMIDGKDITDGTDYETAENEENGEYIIYVPFEPVTKDNLGDYR